MMVEERGVLNSSESLESSGSHVPVMLKEVLSALDVKSEGLYVDATFGGGGYSLGILNQASCQVWGVDRDPHAVARGKVLEESYPHRFKMLASRFGALKEVWQKENLPLVDGMVFDLGVSSFQLDTAERGFSFRLEGPLDMRMGSVGPTAAQVVNEATEQELADIFYYYGEERKARALARAVVRVRAQEKIETTGQLATLIRQVVPRSAGGMDPATRAFQALRIYVNQEMQELEQGLEAAARLVKPQGRVVVVSFHSLEDRLVKEFLEKSRVKWGESFFHPLFKKGLVPTKEEQMKNRRSRSARLRAGVRLPSEERDEETRDQKR
jgi:16S rRNA (cytosine1402-N4)-methyltransferase